jgi:hypothetical protein
MNRPAIVAIRRALIELGRSMQDQDKSREGSFFGEDGGEGDAWQPSARRSSGASRVGILLMDTELKEANAQQRPHARFAQRARMIACRLVGSGSREQEGSHARARPATGHEVQSWWARSPAPRHLPRWTGGSMIIPHPAPSGVRLLCMSFTSNGEVASRACSGVSCVRWLVAPAPFASCEAVGPLGKGQSTTPSNRTGTVCAFFFGSGIGIFAIAGIDPSIGTV